MSYKPRAIGGCFGYNDTRHRWGTAAQISEVIRMYGSEIIHVISIERKYACLVVCCSKWSTVNNGQDQMLVSYVVCCENN